MTAEARDRPPSAAAHKIDAPIDRSRYRRVRRFLIGVLVHALWWDIILNRPLLRRFRRPPLERWADVARRYRDLAVELGGVLIKLGQFLSTRVDLLPLEITRQLADLQDHVPPSPFDQLEATIEEGLGTTIDTAFSWLSPEPIGAASLAQVHPARLHSGEEVVIKVLRPRIRELVATDLAAFRQATRWLRLSRRVRRRVDVRWIEKEFTAVTCRELDLVTEGRSIERFGRDFEDQPDVRVPAVIWSHTGTSVLTMENVAGHKIADTSALIEAGISPAAVARRVYAIYMRQLFETHFVHADPHPGNLFVRLVQTTPQDQTPEPAPIQDCPDNDRAPAAEQTRKGLDEAAPGPAYEIVFVDFGMVTEIPERLRAALREFAIGLATRDARRMVQSYVASGSLLPHADIDRLVEAHEMVLKQLWGIPLGEMRNAALSQAQEMLGEYRDLLLAAPIQLQADMLFAGRAVGLLAGLCTSLDPEFEPWSETVPFAKRFASEQTAQSLPELLEHIGATFKGLVQLPGRMEHLVERMERGSLTLRMNLSEEARQQVDQVERSVDRLSWSVLAGALLISGAVLTSTGSAQASSIAPWLLSAAGLSILVGLIRKRRL